MSSRRRSRAGRYVRLCAEKAEELQAGTVPFLLDSPSSGLYIYTTVVEETLRMRPENPRLAHSGDRDKNGVVFRVSSLWSGEETVEGNPLGTSNYARG